MPALGIKGIPIGPEASAPLGSVFLTPLDTFVRSVTPFQRHTDDVRFYLEDRALWETVLEGSEQTLASLGLALNPTKTKIVTLRATARRLVSDEAISRVLTIGVNTSRGHLAAQELLLGELEKEKPVPSRVRFGLGVVAKAGVIDPAVYRHIASRVDHIDVAPRHWQGLVFRGFQERHLEPEEIIRSDLDFSELSYQHCARQHAVLHAAARGRIRFTTDLRQTLLDVIGDPHRCRRLRAGAAFAISSDPTMKPRAAVALANEIGIDALSRSVLLGTRRRLGRQDTKRVNRLGSVRPGLKATCEYIAA